MNRIGISHPLRVCNRDLHDIYHELLAEEQAERRLWEGALGDDLEGDK